MPPADSFPRQQARTQRFRLGEPRSFRVTPAGDRVLFLRSAAGDDPSQSLWALDLPSGRERLAADAAALGEAEVSEEERARRERVREAASGIVDYAVDAAGGLACFAAGGDVWVVPLGPGGGAARRLGIGDAFDPRLDPTGRWVAWCAGAELWALEVDGGGRRRLAGGDDGRQWGRAEFVAAEEMDRTRGYWWAPDGSGVLAAAVDEGSVATIWIADPVQPERPPASRRYPMAGTADADVTLWWCGLDGTRREVRWDRESYPYVVAVSWPDEGGALLLVERRDHHAAAVLSVDVAAAATSVLEERRDPAWVAWVDGTPARLPDGRLLWSADDGDTRRLTAGGEPLTPPELLVREVHAVDDAGVLFSAWTDPTTVELYRISLEGVVERLSEGGVALAAAAGGGTTVLARRTLGRSGQEARVTTDGATFEVRSLAERPLLRPQVGIVEAGDRRLRTGVLFPADHIPGTKLPVLLRPYGGPGAQQVLAQESIWLEDQWWADQGFAVVVADGRGTPGRGPAWERTVRGDLAGPVLEDQVDALHAVAAAQPDLDLGRVGIMGWSFGGYLSALAVLRRPDVFHAAVAGAPVTDWRLYDTYYTERHLGHPGTDPGPYDRCCLLPAAADLSRPLLVVHGLVDDNVLVAHSLRLSQALLEAGRPHTVLPLSGITHMASREDVAENLLLLQLDFLRRALA